MGKTIEYFMSPQSPWTYLGHARLVAMAAQRAVQVEIKPFDLARVFAASGGLPLAKRAPQRQAYRLQELPRWSQHLGVPLNVQPRFFPVSPDAASHMLIAARTSLGGEAALALAGAIMQSLWVEERNIADQATLVQLADLAGLDGQMLLKSSETAGVKAQYDSNTSAALAANVFGVPWYVVDGESFWGQDRLDFVERALDRQ